MFKSDIISQICFRCFAAVNFYPKFNGQLSLKLQKNDFSGFKKLGFSISMKRLMPKFWYQLFTAGDPWIWISCTILSFSAQSVFLWFQWWQHFEFWKITPGKNNKAIPFLMVLFFTHLSFHWTVPLILGTEFSATNY
jgi:hypothetical protein